MLASIWLAVAGACLIAWYMLCKDPLHRALGVDPFRAAPGDLERRDLPVWLLLAGQIALLVGMAPLFSASLLLRYGIRPAILWTVLGAMLLAATPYMVTLWASLRSGGKSIGAMMYEYLGGRGKQALSVLGWLLSVLMVTMMVGIVASGWDEQPQQVRADDYVSDLSAYREAQAAAENGSPIDLTPYMDTEAFEKAQRSVLWEADQRAIATTASLGMLALSVLFGLLLFRMKQNPLATTAVMVAMMVGVIWCSAYAPLALPHATWVYILLGYALLCALTPAQWLSIPRDALVGVLTCLLALTCVAGALFNPLKVTQPNFVAWRIENGGALFPFLLLTTMAGGLNAIFLFSTSQRTARFALREQDVYPVTFGSALGAAFIGVVMVVAVGQYTPLPLGALGDVFAAPRLLLGSVAMLLSSAGVPLGWATIWVTLVCVGCALGALDTAVRLGTSLMHGIYFAQTNPARALSLDRILAAFITVVAAFLISNVDYWILWPLFGAASLGACAVALIPIAVWLKRNDRRFWRTLSFFSVALALLSLGCLAGSLIAQIHPTLDNLLSNGTLILHCVVAVLLLGAMVHALTGIGRPARELPPVKGGQTLSQ